MTTYNELRKINVNEHTDKKGNLTYLSWSYAVDTLLQHDPMATWEFPEPKTYNDTMMVYCNVTALGKTMKMQLPVMDHRNQAIKNPDSRKISDSAMRCLAKCIACFGIGLYIYSGSDLPEEESTTQQVTQRDIDHCVDRINKSDSVDKLMEIYHQVSTWYDAASLAKIKSHLTTRKNELEA
jgi:hypothetical protein